MNFRERIEQSRERQGNGLLLTKTDDSYCCEYFATDNIKSLPACLDLRLPDGARKAIPYSLITEINFNNGNSIEITASTQTVTINGRYLEKLYDYLAAYRVRYISAHSGTEPEDDGLFVKEIFIEE